MTRTPTGELGWSLSAVTSELSLAADDASAEVAGLARRGPVDGSDSRRSRKRAIEKVSVKENVGAAADPIAWHPKLAGAPPHGLPLTRDSQNRQPVPDEWVVSSEADGVYVHFYVTNASLVRFTPLDSPSPPPHLFPLRPSPPHATAAPSAFPHPSPRPPNARYPSPWPTTRRAARLMEQGGRSSPKSPPELLTPHLATMQRTIGSVGCCLFPAAKAWNLPPSLGRLCCSLVRWTEAVTVWGLSRWGFSRHSRHSSRSSNSSHRHSCCTVGSAGRMTGFPRRQLPAHPPCWWWLLAADLWSRTRPGRSRCLAWTRRPKLLRASAASSAAGSTCYPPSSSSLPRPPPLSWGSTAAPPTPKRGRGARGEGCCQVKRPPVSKADRRQLPTGPAICASPSYPRRRRRPCLLSCAANLVARAPVALPT